MIKKEEKIFSEVYKVINILGQEYITKIPSKCYNLIKSNASKEYSPNYNSISELNENNISREAVSLIILLYLNYWCNSIEEKQTLKDVLEKNQKDFEEKYSYDNMFKRKSNIKQDVRQYGDKEQDESINQNQQILVIKENIFTKIIEKIKKFFAKIKN